MHSPCRFSPRLSVVLVGCILHGMAWADESRLPEVKVHASPLTSGELAGAVTLEQQTLQARRSASSDSASLLRGVPGLSLQGAGGVSSLPVIRGLGDDRLRIKVDGMDLIASCPNHMNPPMSYIDPSQVEAIRVYAGIAPVSVGGDSIGGSIIVESAAPRFAKPGEGQLLSGEMGSFYRSNGKAHGANLAATVASESISLSYTGATAQADNYRAGGNFKDYEFTGRLGHTLPKDEVGSSAYRTQNHTLGLAWRNAQHLVEAKVGYQDMPEQLYPNQRMDLLDNEQLRISLRHAGSFDWGSLETLAYDEKVEHFMDFGADKRYWYGPQSGGGGAQNGNCTNTAQPGCAYGMPMYSEGKTQGLSVKGELPLASEALLRVGTEYQRYRLDDWWTPSGGGMWPGTFLNINDGKRDRHALFAEWESAGNAQWGALLGLRYENVRMNAGEVEGYNPGGGGNQGRDADNFNASDRSKTDHNWDLTALGSYSPRAGLDLEFGFARKTRSPNVYERYTWSTWQMAALMNNFVGDGNGYVGNVALKPEKANTLSLTVDWHSPDRAWQLKATPHYTRVDDYIDAIQWDAAADAPREVLIEDNFTVLKYTNHRATLYGLDLSAQAPLGSTAALGETSLSGVISYTRGKNDSTGDNLYNIMPLNGTLALHQHKGGWRNAVEVEMVDAKKRVSKVRNETPTAGYALLHLRSSYQWGQARFDVGVENLLDRYYEHPLGGAYVGQGTTMTIPPEPNQPQWGTAVPGPGRSIYAGVNIRF